MTQTQGLCSSRCPPQQHSMAFLVLSRHIYSWLPSLGYVSLDALNFLEASLLRAVIQKQHDDPLKGAEWAFFILSPPQGLLLCLQRDMNQAISPLSSPGPTPQKGQAWGMTCTTRKTLLRETVKSHSRSIWEITWGHLPSTFLLGINQWGNRNSQSWYCWFVNSREPLTWRFIPILTVCVTESLQK